MTLPEKYRIILIKVFWQLTILIDFVIVGLWIKVTDNSSLSFITWTLDMLEKSYIYYIHLIWIMIKRLTGHLTALQ